jgi:hypothetical protein
MLAVQSDAGDSNLMPVMQRDTNCSGGDGELAFLPAMASHDFQTPRQQRRPTSVEDLLARVSILKAPKRQKLRFEEALEEIAQEERRKAQEYDTIKTAWDANQIRRGDFLRPAQADPKGLKDHPDTWHESGVIQTSFGVLGRNNPHRVRGTSRILAGDDRFLLPPLHRKLLEGAVPCARCWSRSAGVDAYL